MSAKFPRGGANPFSAIRVLYLENINLILAFIINIISQPIELLNIASAFMYNWYGNARGTF